MRQSKLGFAALALAAFALGGAEASATNCPTYGPMYTQTVQVSNTVVQMGCWFHPATNSMKVYEHRQVTCRTTLVRDVTNCDGTVTQEVVSTVNTEVKTCYQPTRTSCVGNHDWQPTPLCPIGCG